MTDSRLHYFVLYFPRNCKLFCTSPVAQMVKNLPAVWETWSSSLGWEDPLEEDIATHSSTLAWRIPRTEEAGGLQSMWLQRVGQDQATKHSTAHVLLLSAQDVPFHEIKGHN